MTSVRDYTLALAGTCAVLLLHGCSTESTAPVSTGPVVLSVASGDKQTGEVGTQLPQPLTVLVTDAKGRPAPGRIVNFHVVAGGGSVFGGTAMTNFHGLASELWTLGTVANDAQRIEVRAVSADGVGTVYGTFTATATAGPPASAVFVEGDGQQGTETASLPVVPRVLVKDRYKNPVPNARVRFAVVEGDGKVAAPEATTLSDGTASAGAWTLGPKWGKNRLTATVDGLEQQAPAILALGYVNFDQVSGGHNHVCGIRYTGEAFCWGRGTSGQLGNGEKESSNRPEAVYGALTFTLITTGDSHSCGLTPDQIAYCWGANAYGQLGVGSSGGQFTTPQGVAGGLRFSTLSAGFNHTCGITTEGKTYCWGFNFAGALGNGTSDDAAAPTAVASNLAFTTLSSGNNGSCALTPDGAVYCWGYGGNGELGDGAFRHSSVPVKVAGDLAFTALATGWSNRCALTSVGAAYCWGYNHFGQLGDGTTISRGSPVLVLGGRTFNILAGTAYHYCGTDTDGAAFCWGDNDSGQIGDGTVSPAGSRSTPTPVGGNVQFADLSPGGNQTCGRTAPGAAYCWGTNVYGALGNGTTEASTLPSRVTNPR